MEVRHMQILDIVRHKGSDVVTIAPHESVTDLVARLAEHNVGALVVVDNNDVVGIVSERDIVRRLHTNGAEVLTASVRALMTSTVMSAAPGQSVDEVAGVMTENRVRHMPVLADGRLIGIVTIGDVVAARIRQLEIDRGQLESYITHG
jgi:CBS domain-containing protein